MLISELHISNFKSFGAVTQTIKIDNLTALIGSNSSGKTSMILALLKLFGQRNSERTLDKTDFHISEDEDISTISEINLSIEAKITFPEIKEQNSDEIRTIPEFIRHLIVGEPGEDPYLRMRLVGKWMQGVTPDGDIEQELYYVTVPYGHEEQDGMIKVPFHHKKLIQMIYVPAMRDPANQLKNASGTILWRIFNGIAWPETINQDINSLTTPIEELFDGIDGIKSVHEILNTHWNNYYKDKRFSKSQLKFNSNNLDDFLRKVEVLFSPAIDGQSIKVDRLGDGLKSLFYITLVSSLLEIENKQDKEDKPLLNILAIEEPENHISQHILGRVVRNLKEIANRENAQVILSSHNSSIIGKIDPEYIRHLQVRDSKTLVHKIKLPEKHDTAFTYIKEAVKSYPDLYFSKLVVLGEGDSEEIVLPRLLSASNVYLDDFNISIVPLGGRHVNHMWKLLNDLSIPHVTLLDLDRERNGGGWGRIKYILKQLNEINRSSIDLRTIYSGGEEHVYSMEEIDSFHNKDVEDLSSMDIWINKLEKEDVYFSFPLDIDFSMLKSFKEEYQNTMARGPRIPQDSQSPEYNNKLQSSIKATLKNEDAVGNTFSTEEKKLMIWYNSLFLGRGKPSTHIAALKDVEDTIILDKVPQELLRLRDKIQEKIE